MIVHVSDAAHADQYLLSRNAFLCALRDHLIILDLSTNRYRGLAGEDARAVARVLLGSPAVPIEPHAPMQNSSDANKDIIRDLVAAGLLTTDAAQGKSATPVDIGHPTKSIRPLVLLAPEGATSERVDLRCVGSFTRAYIATKRALRLMSFADIVVSVHAYRTEYQNRAHRYERMRSLRALLFTYFSFQTLSFSARGQCLLDSLCLLHFLAEHQIYPELILGVRLRPFLAHAWVQAGPVVYNDAVDHVREFTPIMVM